MLTIDLTKYVLFLGATFLICITPGPDMLYILATGMRFGARSAVAAAVGMSIGMFVYTLAVSVGLAAFFAACENAFFVLRICGGLYLIWIGIQTLRDIPKLTTPIASDQPRQALSVTLRQAFATNLMNPKIAVFYLAYLPQFTNEALGNMTQQLLILGFSFLLLGLAVDSFIGFVSGKAVFLLFRKPKFMKSLKVISAIIYFGLGICMFVR